MSVAAIGPEDKLRVAVVGAGAFGRNHLRVYRELERAGYPVAIAAVIDPNEGARMAAETQYGVAGFPTIEECLTAGKVDAASVCAPTVAHAECARTLLAAGVDLLIEKPLATNMADADEIAGLKRKLVSKETVRGWMVVAELWKAQPRKLGEKHFWRPRRSGYGELVQWDTSNHDWLEGRGEAVRYLVKWIDDATSRCGGRFVLHDGTRENMGVLWQYAEGNGRMVDLYTDRAGIFMVAPRAKESAQQRQEADRLTQFGRGLRELGIGWIPAYSPQAKGRVERSFGTDQDRLVKHLRLAKVKTLQDANKFLEAEY